MAERDGQGKTRVHRVLTGDYSKRVGRWAPSTLAAGQAFQPPQPLFKKLDDSVVADELARLEQDNSTAPERKHS